MSDDNVFALDYFISGVPAGIAFGMNRDNVCALVNRSTGGYDICLIGLIAYFEAFCKDHFASLINICPELLHQFKQKNQNVMIDATALLSLQIMSVHQLGFLIAEQCDFGSAQKINSYYNSLVSVTPFSKDERHKYDKLLNDRNLLVHHGGVYTMSYVRQGHANHPVFNRVFLDSLVVSKDDFEFWLTFITDIVLKIMHSSQKSVTSFIKTQSIHISGETAKAIEYLTEWDV